jgi:transposase
MEFASVLSLLLPDYQVTQTAFDQEQVTISASRIPAPALCPNCHLPSTRLHSYYTRSPQDLSLGSFRLQLNLTVRRMRCLNQECFHQTFAERMPDFLPLYAQRTLRQTQFLRKLVFEVNGEGAARICRHLHLSVSSDTLTRIVRKTDLPPIPDPRIIGSDDWAKHKGTQYGTLIVDLERRHPIAVLSDRTKDTVQQWLEEYPSIQMVSRDRYADYIEAIEQGSPNAIQITDRWHLLKNLSDALHRMFSVYGKELQEVANRLASIEPEKEAQEKPIPPQDLPNQRISHQEKLLLEVKQLAKAGYSNRQIAKMLPIHRETVAHYKAADRIPVRGGAKPYVAARYEPYVLQRWHEGCHSSKQIYQEIRAMGYTGSLSSLYHLLIHLGMKANAPEQQLQPRRLTARQAAWILTAPEAKLNDYQKRSRAELCAVYPEIAEASRLANGFVAMVKERQADQLAGWIEQAKNSSVPKLKTFAAGIADDFSAVLAALTYEWSNAQLEGQINRLKMIKRMMYGRAKLDLLRNRILYH